MHKLCEDTFPFEGMPKKKKLHLRRGHRKSSQKPSETNKTSFTWTPPPLKRTKVRTSGFNSQTNVYTKHHLKPEVRCFRKLPPSETNFVRFTGLLRSFAMVPKEESCERSEQDLYHLVITHWVWMGCAFAQVYFQYLYGADLEEGVGWGGGGDSRDSVLISYWKKVKHRWLRTASKIYQTNEENRDTGDVNYR